LGLHRLKALLDGVLVGSTKRGINKVTSPRASLVDGQLVAVFRGPFDVIQVADNNGEGGEYTFNGVPFPKDSMVQVCMRELPNTPVVLSEMIHVVPVTLAGYPKSMRIDILERARLVMDILIEKSSAFMVKTDAVFLKSGTYRMYWTTCMRHSPQSLPTTWVTIS